MNVTRHNPASSVRPASSYVQGVAVEGAARWLTISGQVGLDPDGGLAGDTGAQMRRCFANLRAVLADAGMDLTNLVKITAFITEPHAVATFREVRDEALDGHLCASTLLVVQALAHPDWTVEVEAVAAA